jgi:competence protein ComGC
MKKLFRILVLAIFVLAIVSFFVVKFYPNVVTGIKPVKDPGEKAKIALDKISKAKDKKTALAYAVNQLPTHGGTLEERVAYWVGYEIKHIDSMKFKLVSGLGISATDAEHKVHEGFTTDQVVVEIFSNGQSYEYFLRCANGLVSKRWPNRTKEIQIGEVKKIDHTSSAYYGGSTKGDQIVTISEGGSLCRDLKMNYNEAVQFAEDWPWVKSYWKNGVLFFMVYPGDRFIKVNGTWSFAK